MWPTIGLRLGKTRGSERGTFSVPIEVGDLPGRRFVEVSALVDTGASDTVLPQDMLARLGVAPVVRRPFRLADERIAEYSVGQARIRLHGEEFIVLVVFAPEGTTPLLGATTLETFSLGVDPKAQRLMPVPGLLK